MSTVGFGDFFPSSTIGRLIGLVDSFMGVFLISMLVVTITNVLMLSNYEHNAYLIIEKLHLEKSYLEAAQNLLAKYVRLVKLYKKEELKKNNADISKLKLKKYEYLYNYYVFQKVSTEIQSTFPPYSVYDAINENLNSLEGEFQEMDQRQDQLGE
eukprot:CAMPEP_0170524960 /NCGR_PEP_ID=MMETSP0209-20121228/10428_1 /TAXON_ID=665100 ORGANISM="Litonotus pictus, Strain P1" /NCGR_SAMPLE_ID=MMETSP0209 /ASSEMBLY_ACC=CAM_ASM_000301 /LENGTH=154 /DNA_ID=CAMNT_0010813963 /DNA_START=879 /DNA_END=1340 /DNA_ORIENTATION=-